MEKQWSAKQMPRLDGKRVVVTGGNRGIGLKTVLELARAGAEVTLTARDPTRGDQARALVLKEVPGAQVTVGDLDLASLASVRAFAARELEAARPIDVLLNNAGVMAFPTRELTADGYERQFGTNHLGHFALVGLLMPLLRAARVVTVSSGLAAFGRLDFTDLQSERRYSPNGAYQVSKLANLHFMLELQRRAPAGLTSVAAHPGVASTDLPQSGFRWLHKKLSQPASQGALSQLYAAVGPDIAPGDYIGPSGLLELSGPPKKVALPKRALIAADSAALWEISETLTNVHY